MKIKKEWLFTHYRTLCHLPILFENIIKELTNDELIKLIQLNDMNGGTDVEEEVDSRLWSLEHIKILIEYRYYTYHPPPVISLLSDFQSMDYIEFKDKKIRTADVDGNTNLYEFTSEIYNLFQESPFYLLNFTKYLPYSLQEIIFDNSGKSRPSISPAIGNLFNHFDIIFRYT